MDRYVFFGGKGGVGKTTVSAAYGYRCAAAGLETLVVSTDPAHSVGDLFDQSFGDDPRAVDGVDNLFALEIDPEEEVSRHLTDIKRTLSDQVSAAMVNTVDRQIEMAHGTPGAYEAALFDRFVTVMRDTDRFDRIVFDTSPTGGTLRLLSLPDLLEGWITRLMAKRRKSIDRYEKAALGGREPRRVLEGDPVLAHLEQRKEFFEYAGETLREEASFVLVFNPDSLSIRETERAIEDLSEQGLEVSGLVANRLTPAPDPDEDGRGARYLRSRVATERDRLESAHTDLEPPVVAELETRVTEIGLDELDGVAAELEITI
ncbi:TRC40/GET3/ArsA family transport-energizing ATPase [Natronolimnobius sp. AArcel1]|uniref:ArsA family ATPase n=1 Tax=Natronolimnobius sp. AArcel1 TaxID=1679093 RepID=UPI0013EA20D8|nr:TRC40/GET3/ArsA family transport-energizing ATPase [Natronolimnobius sp. AArcel1]NGM67924.1 TRC40/GET3/ArsA family transport-energizing ATPase [Natronolimnobius sp. AArcel1]